jgi:hypothetical protein
MAQDYLRAEFLDGTYVHRYTNKDINGVTQGSAIVDAYRIYDGREVGGQTYYLSYSNITSTHVDVTITAAYSGNSQNATTVTIARDGTTLHRNIVRGWVIALSASGSFATSWKSTVHDGLEVPASCCIPGNPEGLTYDFTTGLPAILTDQGAGAPAMRGILNIRNVSGELAVNTRAVLMTPAALKPIAGAGIYESAQVGSMEPKLGAPPGYKVEPYVITFDNLDTVPAPDTIDVLIDGVTYAAVKVSTGEAVTTETVDRNGTSRYQVTDGDLSNWTFVVASTATDSDSAELRVWPVQYQAIRNALTGGAFETDQDVDVPLNATGSPAGEVPNNGVAQLEMEATIPYAAGFAQNPVLSLSVFLKASFTLPSGA